MARRRPSAVLLLAALPLAGCAARRVVTLPAIGPIADEDTRRHSSEDSDAMRGTLVVYSETLPMAKHRSPPVYTHTGYVIFRASGGQTRVVSQVDNQTSETEPQPDEVPLEAGLYQIQARAAKVGTVVVPVVIAPGRRTEVYLDATGMPSAESRTLQDPVTLSDGRVVGARAGTSPQP